MEFTERMELGRVQAVQKRNRGFHTGKAAKGWNAKKRYDDEATWAEKLAVTRIRWELARDEALNIYASAMFPERYDDLPF